MNDDTDSRRTPTLDDQVDGLDCFVSEDDVVDSADDAGTLVEAPSMVPAVQASLPRVRYGVAEARQWTRDRSIRSSLVATLLLVVGSLTLWLTERSDRPGTVVVETPAPAPAAAPSLPAAPPVVRPVPAPPVVRVVEPSSRPTARSVAARSIAPGTVPAWRPPATLSAPSSPPAASLETAARAFAPPAPPAPTAEEPVVVASPEIVRAEPAAAAPAPSVAAIAVPTDRASIERVLQAYRDAYDRLDAPAAAVIWPGVDTRALNRAFNSLTEQDVSFERCDLDIAGVKANAKCTGEIRYVRRIGDQNPRVRRLSWSFAFERVSDRWQIAQVTAD